MNITCRIEVDGKTHSTLTIAGDRAQWELDCTLDVEGEDGVRRSQIQTGDIRQDHPLRGVLRGLADLERNHQLDGLL